jgi:hypothetical protein
MLPVVVLDVTSLLLPLLLRLASWDDMSLLETPAPDPVLPVLPVLPVRR